VAVAASYEGWGMSLVISHTYFHINVIVEQDFDSHRSSAQISNSHFNEIGRFRDKIGQIDSLVDAPRRP
jgi:hypothetical protein